jgi:hypothetical protein
MALIPKYVKATFETSPVYIHGTKGRSPLFKSEFNLIRTCGKNNE